MGNLDVFINYLEAQVKNHSIYVFGAQGEKYPTITASWIAKMETTPKNAERAIAHWKKECELGYEKVLRAFDCSGLGMYELHIIFGYPDATADTMFKKYCEQITKAQLKRGDWVFKRNSVGKCTHVGYVVDNNLNVIEAKGRDYGVVKLPFARGDWNCYGRPSCFASEIENVWIATRPLHYEKPTMKGEDVAELQRRLIERGFSCGKCGDDGSYGQATEKAVRAYQESTHVKGGEYLVVDGRAGRKTLTSLGAICKW